MKPRSLSYRSYTSSSFHLVLLLSSVFSITAFIFPDAQAKSTPSENMILIPEGVFQAGEKSSSKKIFLGSFYIDRFEITQKQYERLMKRAPSFFKEPQRPVEKVSWYDADEYCKKAGKRLPTEWEWEKAAKSGTTTRYYWGEEMNDEFAWHKNNANQQTHPVGKKRANAYGLFDMSGNVWEWTASDHPAGGKVVRGGSWRNKPQSLRPASRINSNPRHRFHYVGFRCAGQGPEQNSKSP